MKKLFGIKYSHLDNNSQIILGTAYLENGVSNARMQSVLELHSTEIGHILSNLVEQKMLIADKKGRWTRYYLNQEYKIEPEQYEISDFENSDKKFKNETDRIIFEYIKVNGFITVHQVLDITRITTNQGANVALGRLINAGVVQKVRQGRHFIYQLK